MSFQLRAGRFDELAVFHAAGACGFTGAAGQAKFHVFAVTLGDGRAVCDLDHLVDPSARGIHLDAEFAIRRAGVETQATVYAPVQIGPLGLIVGMRLL
jgi:hypothetical protein